MTYKELTRKYLLKGITEEEYKRGKDKILERLFDLYEDGEIDAELLRDRMNRLR